MSLDYVRQNIPLARALRADMTPQERHLWYDGLRKFSVRFQRQKAIGPYIADFYCHRARLVVELDGSQHHTEEARAYDERRTAFLGTQGVEVLRFRNRTIDEFFDLALREIAARVNERIAALANERKSRVLPQPRSARQPPPGGGLFQGGGQRAAGAPLREGGGAKRRGENADTGPHSSNTLRDG